MGNGSHLVHLGGTRLSRGRRSRLLRTPADLSPRSRRSIPEKSVPERRRGVPRSTGWRCPSLRRPRLPVRVASGRPATRCLGWPGALRLWCPAALVPGSLAAWRVGPRCPALRGGSAPFCGPASLSPLGECGKEGEGRGTDPKDHHAAGRRTPGGRRQSYYRNTVTEGSGLTTSCRVIMGYC